jgi:hypothetical protein
VYLFNANEVEKEEILNCIKNLELFSKNYDSMFIMASFIEEVKLYSQRLHFRPKKRTIVRWFSRVILIKNIKYFL